MFVIGVATIAYLLLYNLHDCIFKSFLIPFGTTVILGLLIPFLAIKSIMLSFDAMIEKIVLISQQ